MQNSLDDWRFRFVELARQFERHHEFGYYSFDAEMLPAEIEKVEEWEGDGVVVRCKTTIAIMEGGLAPRDVAIASKSDSRTSASRACAFQEMLGGVSKL